MDTMNNQNTSTRRARLVRAASALAFATALVAPAFVQAQVPFAKAEAAADALIQAVASSDTAAMPRLLGKDWRRLLPLDGVSVNDQYLFLEKSAQARAVNVDGRRADLVIGTDPWTLPIPIVQGRDGQWRFDPVAARTEIQARRLGENERSAIQAALAYVDAQREYALADRNGDGVLEYAQKLLSVPGKRDGLIWSASLGDDSPLGEAFVPRRPGEGYHGYHFKVLTGQGPKAKGGARSYLLGQRMVSGYGLLAWPVKYGSTGVMSFVVNQDGTVFERDLGPQTAQAAAGVKAFNPGEGWKPAKP